MPLDSLLSLQNAYAGKRGFIVATGPSLAYKNMSFLKDEITISMNLGPLMFDQWDFIQHFILQQINTFVLILKTYFKN